MLLGLQFVSALLLIPGLAWLGDAIGKHVDAALGETRMRDRNSDAR